MEINVYFNPLQTACKNIIGGIKQGETLELNVFLLKESVKFQSQNSLYIPKAEDCYAPNQNALLRLNKDGESLTLFPMQKTPYGWHISFTIHEIGLYFYSFEIEKEGIISCGKSELGYLSKKTDGFLLLVSSKDYQTPDWFKGGIMYQIFPDRFCKIGSMSDIDNRIIRQDWEGEPEFRPNEYGKVLNNDFFGGNFKGIVSKLPYLQSLGVTIIYLNPIFEAASNHRYDTSDYMNIDPFLGNEQDFDDLIKTAEKYGIKIILDGVFNHNGDDSVYFNKYGRYSSLGAYQSKKSPYYSWYSFDKFPDKYSSWWGIDTLPQVNENSEDYQNFIFGKNGVLKKWLKFGIGGYRLDVADELPDFFLKKLRNSVKESNPDAIIIGEVWEDASTKIAYSQRREYLQGYELDSVMNYPVKEGIIRYMQSENAEDLLNTVRALINHYPKETLDCLMNILGTHDTARILTVLGGIYCHNKEEMAKPSAYLDEIDKEKAIKKLKTAAVLQYTLPGVPCIYYGDENGMEGHIDPFCRRCFNWEHLNKDLIAFYQKLGALRREYYNIFKNATFQELHVENGLLFFKRENEYGTLYIYVNHSPKEFLLKLPGNYQDILADNFYKDNLKIAAYSYGILRKK